MIRLVILDLDDTLYPERHYLGGVMAAFEAELGLSNAPLRQALGGIDRHRSRDILGDTLLGARLYSEAHHDRLFELYCSVSLPLSPFEDTVETLDALRQMGCRTAILTNGVATVQKNKVRCLGAQHWVDHIFYARKNPQRKEKPHPMAFKKVLEHFRAPPSSTLMVGDNYQNDYLGAREAGLHSLWFNPSEKGGRGRVHHLGQTLEFIRKQCA